MNENILKEIYKDIHSYEGTKISQDLFLNNIEFRNVLLNGLKSGQIEAFSKDFLNELTSLNMRGEGTLDDAFRCGANLGACTVASKLVSYIFDSCYICGGVNKFLIGTKNSPDGRHTWIEHNGKLYDTTFMLVIDKSLEEKFGYVKENYYDPNLNPIYLAGKEYACDKSLSR